ncbi:MAG: maleylpyruvate isomerase family mycothiol-dependent enzyme [Anaerolineae bacterium]
MKTSLEPVIAEPLFAPVRAELIKVLSRLSDEQWEQPTVCTGWTVRDVALHLLGDDVGFLSGLRDRDGQRAELNSLTEIIEFIDAQNDRWVKATRRMSRRLLISLLLFTGQQCREFIASLDPYEMSGPIGWAGDQPDPQWLHIAREYTEHWMHHQHICEAAGIVSLKDAQFLNPVLNTFVHALPYAYRNTTAPDDSLVKLVITGEGGGEWHLVREEDYWKLYATTDLKPITTVTLDVDSAWRMFTKGIAADTLRQQATIVGNKVLGEVALNAVAIMG